MRAIFGCLGKAIKILLIGKSFLQNLGRNFTFAFFKETFVAEISCDCTIASDLFAAPYHKNSAQVSDL